MTPPTEAEFTDRVIANALPQRLVRDVYGRVARGEKLADAIQAAWATENERGEDR